MVNIADIQASLVAYLKGRSEVTTSIGVNPLEIRESYWQGEEFVYPAYRVAMGTQVPQDDTAKCGVSLQNFTVVAFAEDASSQNCAIMNWKMCNLLHGASFSDANVKLNKILCRIYFPAERIDDRTWMAKTDFVALVQKK